MIKPVLELPIIGYMNSPYMEKFGIPRQPNLVQVESYIEMQPPYNDLLAFEGIEQFSHLWLLWNFHDNKHLPSHDKFRPQVRPPRLGGNQKMGVFATRSMYRPAPVGLSVVQFKAVRKVGHSVRVYVNGSDLLHGTPIIDIKPYIQYSDAVPQATSGYAQAAPIKMAVIWTECAEQHKHDLIAVQQLDEKTVQELEQVLALDPRPAYQHDAERVYKMDFAQLAVSFSVQLACVVILDVAPL